MSPNFIIGNHHQIHVLTFLLMLQCQDALGRTHSGQNTAADTDLRGKEHFKRQDRLKTPDLSSPVVL